MWIIPALAAAFVGWLVYASFERRGPELTIAFADAEGIKPDETALHFRGVPAGEVTAVELEENGERVFVHVELIASAADLARQGSEFWIVRPEISLGEIRGLTTLVSGSHLAVRPGSGERTTEFVGLDEPPSVERRGPEGLRLTLLAADLGSIEEASPVRYRGVRVGEVLEWRLADDAQTVEVHVRIEPPFAPLVRMSSRFWQEGEVRFEANLFEGAEVEIPSAKSFLSGGISFATPSGTDERARDGTAFRLHEAKKDEWPRWSPEIRLGEGRTP